MEEPPFHIFVAMILGFWILGMSLWMILMEQDSNSEGADESDETNDILDDFDGGEIELMFTKNYGEYYTFV